MEIKTVYLFLADGFEEIEGLTVVDILRRGGVNTITVSVAGKKDVTGSHGITVLADQLFEEIDFPDDAMFVLPGGQPGSRNLKANDALRELFREKNDKGCRIAAICAAPGVLGSWGILEGKRALCYPGVEEQLEGALPGEGDVVHSKNVTTSRGMGTAVPFALCLLEQIKGEETADRVAKAILWK